MQSSTTPDLRPDTSADQATSSSSRSAPDVLAAERAAAAIVRHDENVRQVVLYGSVASGVAGTRSDIDLLAVCEDIDYRARHMRSLDLGDIASRSAGWPTSVLLTDVPELEWRTRYVTSSFEAKVLACAVVLVDRPMRLGLIRGGKEIGAERSDSGEAASRLGDICEPLSTIAALLRSAAPPGVPEARWHRRRTLGIIRHASMILESSVKALHHVHAGVWPDKESDPRNLLAVLPPCAAKSDIQALLDDLAASETHDVPQKTPHTDWRSPGPRCGDIPHSWWHTNDRALLWAQTALSVAQVATGETAALVPDRPEVLDAQACATDMSSALMDGAASRHLPDTFLGGDSPAE